MFKELLEYAKPYFDHSTQRGRVGLGGVVLYLVLSIVSIAWAASGGVKPDNELGATVEWTVGEDGFTSLVITNQGDEQWTNVRVMLDERYYHFEDTLNSRHTFALTLRSFEDGFLVPRPEGMYPFEYYTRRPDAGEASATYRPTTVRISADQGELSTSLSR